MKKTFSYISTSVTVKGYEISTSRERRGSKVAAAVLSKLESAGATVVPLAIGAGVVASLIQGDTTITTTITDAASADRLNTALAASSHPITENF